MLNSYLTAQIIQSNSCKWFNLCVCDTTSFTVLFTSFKSFSLHKKRLSKQPQASYPIKTTFQFTKTKIKDWAVKRKDWFLLHSPLNKEGEAQKECEDFVGTKFEAWNLTKTRHEIYRRKTKKEEEQRKEAGGCRLKRDQYLNWKQATPRREMTWRRKLQISEDRRVPISSN